MSFGAKRDNTLAVPTAGNAFFVREHNRAGLAAFAVRSLVPVLSMLIACFPRHTSDCLCTGAEYSVPSRLIFTVSPASLAQSANVLAENGWYCDTPFSRL